MERRVKTVEGCEPAGFETEEVTWSFEEVGEKTQKSAPDGGRRDKSKRVKGKSGGEKHQDKNTGKCQVNHFVSKSQEGAFYPFAHAGSDIPMRDGIL